MAETIGERIRRARTAYGMSQAELARRIGISPNAMYYIERGRTQNPQASRIIAIARVLRVRPDFLLGFTDEMDIKPAEAEKAA